MSAQVVQLKPLVRSGWSSRELGEFYRVESALIQAGLRIETDCGVSDEGDPWFVFCGADSGEVIVHIARIDRSYILAGPAYAGVASGSNIAAMVRDLLERHPLVRTPGQSRGSKIFLHPASLLIAVVAAAFFKSSEARALSPNHPTPADTRGGAATAEHLSSSARTVVIGAEQGAVVLSAILTALSHDNTFADKLVSAPNAEFLTSSFVDSSGFSTGVTHAIGTVLNPQNLHGDGIFKFSPVEPLPAAHSGVMAAAVPLFALLSDLAKTATPEVTVAQEIRQSSSSGHGPTNVDLLILSVTFAPSRADSALPSVHSLSLSTSLSSGVDSQLSSGVDSQLSSGVDSHPSNTAAPTTLVVEANTPSQLDHLSSALVTALKATSHTVIATPEGGTTPFATMLVSFLTGYNTTNSESINSNSTGLPITELHQSENGGHQTSSFGVVAPSNEVSTNATPHSSLDAPPSQFSALSSSASSASTPAIANVEFLVQEFFAHASHFQTITAGQHMVVYDADAIVSHPANELASVTFDFSDGSMLSLVGLPAALHHSVIV